MSTNPTGPAAPQPEKEATASILSDLQGTGGEQSVMPDLGGVNPSTPGSKYKVHSQTLVIALVLAASGGALFMMRKQGMGAGIRFEPPKIDYNMDKASTPADAVHQQRVLSDLEKSKDLTQVPADKIQKNPFQLDTHPTTMAAGPADTDSMKSQAAAAEQQVYLQKIATALASIEVNAIMEGTIPLARINGKIVREGDTVADLFKVKEIHDRSVDLEAGGKLFTVNMSENTGGGKLRPPMPRK